MNLNRGKIDRAMCDIRMALHHNPRFLNAQKLQEELLGRRMWDDEGSRSRTFMYDLIRNEDEAMLERLERPMPLEAGLDRVLESNIGVSLEPEP